MSDEPLKDAVEAAFQRISACHEIPGVEADEDHAELMTRAEITNTAIEGRVEELVTITNYMVGLTQQMIREHPDDLDSILTGAITHALLSGMFVQRDAVPSL